MASCLGLRKSLRLRLAVLAVICAKAVGLVVQRSEATQTLPSSSASTFSSLVAGETSSLPLKQGLLQLNSAIKHANCDYIQNKSAQRYIMLGGFGSGTNLLHNMMFNSWPNSVCKIAPRIMWKHAATGVDKIYNHLSSLLGAESLSKIVILHSTRSPLSELASWMKAPYDLKDCVYRSVSTWNEPCFAAMGPDSPSHRNETATRFPSTMAAYIQYMKQFEELRKHGGFKAVVAVPYEDMILTPGKMMKHIAKHFDGLDVPNDVMASLEAPAIHFGPCIGHAESLEKLHKRSYLNGFTEEDLKTICDGLNQTLLEGHIEGSFLKPDQQVSYWHDCRGRSSE